MITKQFFVTGGTVTGYAHRQAGRNNQDGFFMAEDAENFSAVVCDGCSSARDSEVGAKLIARFAAGEILRLMKRGCAVSGSEILKELQNSIVDYLKNLTGYFPDPLSADDMFLATIVGVVMNEFSTTVFSLGDGVISLNGNVEIIDENNAPNYLAYLTHPGNYKIDEEKIAFVVRQEIATDEAQTIIIATDGAKELAQKADREICVLGKPELVKGLNQFEQEVRYMKNPTLLQKRLFQLNAERVMIDWEKKEVKKFEGILSDDTTIVLIKRKEAPAPSAQGGSARQG